MSEEMFVRCCAPTLAGIKTGSMFNCEYDSREEMASELRELNRIFSRNGMCILPLRYHNGKALLYLFRPGFLQEDFRNRDAREILDEAGYKGMPYQQCIRQLIRRIGDGQEFPHEIGLFLSYPPEDVRGFIENHAQNYKFVGYWKVYGDEEKARRTFEQYRKCTDSYCRRIRAGYPLAELAVAV